ncbi:DHH family phosphoesterase [bacterium]|nr:DHH family phosphoesterase [bacterium]
MINLTHYDLDGVSSSIIISHFIKDIVPIPTGYNYLKKKATDFIIGQSQGIITDLNFNKELFDLIKKSKHKYLYIDHHKLDLDLSEYDTLTYYIDERFCATANILSYFKQRNKYTDNENIKKLAYYTNDYDTWLLKTEESQILNFIFWKVKFEKFFDMFKNGYNEKYVEENRKPFRDDYENARKYLDKCKKDEFKYDEIKCIMFYASEYQNLITIFYPNYDYYFIISDVHKMSIRTTTNISLEYSFKDIEKLEGVETAGCHDFAGGVNLCQSLSEEEASAKYFRIMDIILQYTIRF